MKAQKTSRKRNRVTPRKTLKTHIRSIRRSRKKVVKSIKKVKFQKPLTECNQSK